MDNVTELRRSKFQKATNGQKSQRATNGEKRSAVNGTVYLSCTVTPFGKRGGTEFPDGDRLQACQDFAEALYTAMQIRMSDGQVNLYSISVERGEDKANPHGQGVYGLANVLVDDATAIKREKAWLKKIWASVSTLPVVYAKL